MLTVFNLFKEDKNAIRRNLPRAVTNELNTVLTGCRIEKVYQPIAMKSLFRHADKAVRAVF